MPDDVELLPGAAAALRRYRDQGYRLLGTAWAPELAAGTITAEDVAAVMRRTHELLGVALEWAVCPHAAGPPVCWCRKPLPGLVVTFLERHRLDPARCVYVGPSAADRTLARRLGMTLMEVEDFLAE